MTNTRNIVLAGVGVTAVIASIALLMIWPNYRQAASVRSQTANLRQKINGLSSQSRQVEQLAQTVVHQQHFVDDKLKVIPESPDLASLIRKLSQTVDRVRVLDQTFTAGSLSEAIIGGKETMQAMPLTVDMHSTFDSVFALVQNAESMHRLVRVSTVRIVCKREDEHPRDIPLVRATVTLEAIFDPPVEAGGE